MKIGIVIQWMSRRNGGVFESAKLACQALLRTSCSAIEIFSAEDERIDADTAELENARINRSREFGTRRFGFAPGMVIQMLRADIDLAVVHGLWTSHSLAAWIWHRITNRPYILVPHGMLEPWILGRSPKMKRLVWRLFTRDLIARASAVQVLTEKEGVDVNILVPSALCVLIPNFVPELPRRLDICLPDWWEPEDEGKTVFLFFGRIHEKKGVVEACEAWAIFCSSYPRLASDCRLIFCGWIDGVPDFETTVSRASASLKNARFAGPQYGEKKWSTLCSSTFMLLPSKSEGLPMSILEGWSVGLPAIMTEECNIPAAFEVGAALRTGYGDAEILGSYVKAAQMAQGDRDAMKNAGKHLVQTEYSEEKFVARMVDLCQRIKNEYENPHESTSQSSER